jgi:hypothetical protein
MEDIKKEFWGDLQADLFTANTAVYLANQRLENLIRQDGRKAHRPILSHPDVGTYTPYNSIDFQRKTATKQTLEVDTFEYSAEEIDITDKLQTPYDLLGHSLNSIRKGLMNRVEQEYLSEIPNAFHRITGTPEVTSANILDILEEAEGKLGAFDAPYETSMRAAVFGPRTVARLRRAKSDRETRLGDSVLENGVIGPWQGWTVVQNNNLPWSAKVTIAATPTDGDTVTIAGVVFTLKDALSTTPTVPGEVLIGGSAANAKTNLLKAITGDTGAGTSYTEISLRDKFMLRRKRCVGGSINTNDLDLTGFGDIAISVDFTSGSNLLAEAKQDAVFMVRGAIDLVLQFMDLKVGDKEAGFADLPKGVIGVGTRMFDDGQVLSVRLQHDVMNFK